MFQNWLAAALRSLVRERLYAVISIAGLAVGFAAALMIAAFARDEFSYDKWFPGYDRTYAVATHFYASGNIESEWNTITAVAAERLKLGFPSIEDAARFLLWTGQSVRQGDREFLESIYWADPTAFAVLPLPAFRGDLTTALREPESVVLTRRMARKYFGSDDIVGRALDLNHRYTLHVTAVLEDLPSNTSLNTEIIVAGNSAQSPLATIGTPLQEFSKETYTFIRLKPGASIEELRRGARDFSERQLHDVIGNVSRRMEPIFIALPEVHLTRLAHNDFGFQPMTPIGNVATIKALLGIGVVIIAIALANFVNLMTARASRRAVEVGVRKLSGAERWQLIAQFIGETAVYVATAVVLALVMAISALPAMNNYLQRDIHGHALLDAQMLTAIVLAAAASALLAGFYPAAILSALRPATILGGAGFLSGGRKLRQFFVLLQFAILIGLMSAAGVVYWQVRFAENEALKIDKDEVILINAGCRSAFHEEVQTIPGVLTASCSGGAPLTHSATVRVRLPDGSDDLRIASDPVDFGFFELFGIKPLAGRLLSQQFGKDNVTADANWQPPNVVINETLAARLGYSAREAVGRTFTFMQNNYATKQLQYETSEIVGVVPDFPTGSVASAVVPTAFYVSRPWFFAIQVKLAGQNVSETLRAIELLYSRYTAEAQPDHRPWPFNFTFFDQRIGQLYRDVARESQLLALFSAVAIFVASIGLFGLASFTAERRTKEIGVRKALGARGRDVLGLLLWEYAKPVVLANVIAWPVVYLVMRRWLEGFAYHISMQPWILLSASAAALLIAVVTVAAHAFSVSRAQPARALRYE
jgi:putative ABC transport system permease protein